MADTSTEFDSVQSSAEYISKNSKDVFIDRDAVKIAAVKLLEEVKKGSFDLQNWKQHPLNPKDMTEQTLQWIFIIDTLNFSFFNDKDKPLYSFAYKGITYTGYWSLCAAINAAIDRGVPITDAYYLSHLTIDQLREVFPTSHGEEVPLIAERLQVLREAGSVLLEKFDGHFKNCIKKADGSAMKLLNLIVSNFSSYNDTAQFEGRTVKIYKRAQILIADVWACFEGQSFGAFNDIDKITMFADYRVPQVLAYLGVIKYSEYLLDLLQKGTPIASKSRLEVEIRGNSIWVVEEIRREMEQIISKYTDLVSRPHNAIAIDFYLWDFAKANASQMAHIPIHRTRCTFY